MNSLRIDDIEWLHYVAYFRYTCSDMFTCQKNLREDEWGHVLFPLHYLMYRKVIKVYCVAVVPNCVLKLNFGFVFALSVWYWSRYFLNKLELRNRSLVTKKEEDHTFNLVLGQTTCFYVWEIAWILQWYECCYVV